MEQALSGWIGKALALVGVLLLAFVVARSCGSSAPEVSQDEAVEIARAEIRYEPDGVQVRNVPQGVQSRRVWAVSLYEGSFTNPTRVTVVEVDAETGDVRRIHSGSP